MTKMVRVLLVTSDGEFTQTVKGALTGQGSPGAMRIRQDFLKRWSLANDSQGGLPSEPPKWGLTVCKSIDSASDCLEALAQQATSTFLVVIDGDIDQHESVLLFMLTVQAISESAHIMLVARGGGVALRQAIEELGDPQRCTYIRRPVASDELARTIMYIVWRSLMTFSLRQAEQRGFSGVGAADLASALLIEGEAEQRRMAVQDTLTKLGNRRLFDATLSEVYGLPTSHRTHVLMLIDLDRFKAVNDTLGHAAGDELLKQVADRLRAVVGPNDVVFRLGGDEFALIKADAVNAQELAEKIIAEMVRPFEVFGHPAKIGASIGWTLPDASMQKADDWTARADMALYAAKGAGRGVAIRYSADQDRSRQERESLERRLRDLMLRGSAPLLFAPVAEATSGRIVAVEAVLDFAGDGLADLNESRLDSLVSDPKLATELAFWAAASAIEAATRLPYLQIAINITPRAFQNDMLVERLAHIADSLDVGRGRLIIEVPATSVFGNLEAASTRIKAIVDAGFGVSLDDFGVGLFSVDGLLRLQVDSVKIAPGFACQWGRAARGVCGRR
jgi:diguanylate cyclase (GGDEF)-like protein